MSWLVSLADAGEASQGKLLYSMLSVEHAEKYWFVLASMSWQCRTGTQSLVHLGTGT